MLRNLLSNAFKFTKAGGVLVGARPRGGKVAVEVYDTGPGIPAGRLGTIFAEFERAQSDAFGPNAGLGLGLSIVERYSKLIGAEIEVRSVPGRGSRFTILMPRASIANRAIEHIEASASASRLDGVRVLLIDDNASVLDALGVELSDRGALVQAVPAVSEAARALAEGYAPDIAIVDYDLGAGSTGVEQLAKMRHAGYVFPSIILTGRTDKATLSIIADSNLPWMTKPADPGMLVQTIARLVPNKWVAPPQTG